jgi:hypothetical protein
MEEISTAEEFLKNKFTEIYNRKPLSFREKLPLNRYLELYVTGRTDGVEENYPEMIIEFAKLHVERALKKASLNAMIKVTNTEEFREIEKGEDLLDFYDCGSDTITVSVNSILNAYPLSNIQ